MPDLRKLKSRGRRGRVPRPVPPNGIQVRYLAFLMGVLDKAHALVKERLVPYLEALVAHGDRREDAKPKRVNSTAEAIAQAMLRAYSQERLAKMATAIAQQTSAHQKEQLFRQVKAAVGVPLSAIQDKGVPAMIRQFTAENVALIKTIPQQYLAQVETTVLQGMNAGKRHEEIALEIEERYEVASSRAELIARDQVLSFQADLNNTRQQNLGFDKYIWRTANDQRVREVHAEREGMVCEWAEGPGDPDDPSDGEHPGDGILCRCFAEPDASDIVEGVDQR